MIIKRNAWLTGWIINGMLMAMFEEIRGNTISLASRFFKDEHEALLEIGTFKHQEIFKKLASV